MDQMGFFGGTVVFDSPVPEVEQEANFSTISLGFSGCNEGTVTYEIPAANLEGIVPITRVTNDNVALCKALNAQ